LGIVIAFQVGNGLARMEVIERSSTLAERAYHSILEAICEGRLSPGEKLTQEVIAEKLKISRIPVAQALLTLKQQAFVQQNGRRSLFVARPDPKFFSAIYQLRSALDPLAAQLAAKNATPESLASCQRILSAGERAVNSGNVSKLVAADMEFHMFIYRLSGNQLISEIMELYWNHLRRGMAAIYRTRAHRGDIWSEHAAIFKAIAKGDTRHARGLALQHVQIASKVVPAALAELGH
jgi:DNA-binding GntR family transcriptional regulator